MVPQPPPEWGNDELSKFLQQTHANQYATFVRKRGWYNRLSIIDSHFYRVATNVINPRNPVAVTLFYRSHSAFRAACGNAMAGQAVETMVVVRSCLENAAYSLHIHENPGHDLLWLNRNQTEAETKAMKAAFLNGRLRETIGKKDKRLLSVFDELYERAIDFGGHPNQRGISGSAKMVHEQDHIQFLQIYLHNDDISLDHALKTTAQTGICALRLAQFTMKEKFELLGVREGIDRAQQGL